ncbi:hypothetical protein TNCV_4181761 [Trichonephila clavipes]|nr:hypothetical protein TNCV_4181761 [Trichonephila clavipes]
MFTMGPPHTHMIVIPAEIEPGFIPEDCPIPFGCNPIPSCVTPLQTEVIIRGCQWQYTHNSCNDSNERTDTVASSEDAACVWMTGNEIVGAMCACSMK